MGPLVIVGTGLAGYNLAKEWRKLDTARELIMLTADDGRNYSKPMLSTGFTKSKTADELAMADAATMATQLNAKILTRTKVESLNTHDRILKLSDGSELVYGDLVLAQGADVVRVPLEGDGLDYVYSVNDLEDYARFRAAIDGKKKIVIMGAGLIGCEFANDLSNGGYQVEVVDPVGRCLPALLPEAASAAVQAALEGLGVKFHMGPLVQAVNKTDTGVAVKLSNGDVLQADIVVSAIGLRPRVQLAKEAGIQVNRGIVVTKALHTSAAHVYALGDCAEVEAHVLLYVLPLMAGARALAKTLAGEPTEVAYPAMPVAVKTPVCPVVVSPAPIGVEGQWEVDANGANVKALFRDNTGALRGFALTGDATAQKNALAKELPAIF